MAEYIGWEAIARRFGVSRPTVQKWHRELGLLVYRRNLAISPPPRCRWAWVTNDELILAWQIARAKIDRQWALAQLVPAKLPGKTADGAGSER